MTDAEKAALLARLRAAESDAAKRGLRLTGYHLDAGRLSFISEPAGRKRRAAPPPPPAPVGRVVRRGVAQGSLL